MKVKSKINLKPEIKKKQSSLLNIFDIFAEKTESFSINTNKTYEHINYNNRFKNIIYLNGLYPRIKIISKYENEHMNFCKIENFKIYNNASKEKIIKISKCDTQKNIDNFNNNEIYEIPPKKDNNNDNLLHKEKLIIKLKNNSSNNIKKQNKNKNLKNNININSDLSDIIKITKIYL